MIKVSNNKKIAAIVVTYNRKELLKECINALLDQDYENCDVLVIDNASTDGTENYIAEEIKNKKVKYYNTGANLGGAGGFNYGMRKAVEEKYEYAWVMDDDCIVQKDTLEKLLIADGKIKEYGFLASKVLWGNKEVCKMNIQKKDLFHQVSEEEYQKNDYQKIIMSTFVSFFIKTAVIKEIGLPIKEFFIWADDLEYSRRISKKYECYLIKDSIVNHKTKTNIGSNIAIDSEEKLNRYEYAYRNEMYLMRREGLVGRLYMFIKKRIHIYRVHKAKPTELKKRIRIIKDSIKKGKKFNPKIEYVFDCPIRVLQMFGEPLSTGGQESAIMNLYRHIDRNRVQFDFFTPFYNDNLKLREEIESLGGNVFFCDKKFESIFRKHYFVKGTKEFFSEHNYEIVHINSGSIYELAVGAKIAKKQGVKKVIVHSHSTGMDNIKHKLSKWSCKKLFKKYPDKFIGCSQIAGEWKFPDEIVKNQNIYSILKNGIDLEKFRYDSNIRKKYRQDLNVDNKKVIINVGRLSFEKNQKYLIEVMRELVKKDNSFALFIVGQGMLENELVSKIEEYGLSEYIKLLGKRSDIPELLCASDIFAFPSLWEGSPVSTVEAQATGIPVICSTNVTEEAKIIDSFTWCEIDKKPIEWAERIINIYNEFNNKRKDESKVLKTFGFDAKDTANRLEEVYIK